MLTARSLSEIVAISRACIRREDEPRIEFRIHLFGSGGIRVVVSYEGTVCPVRALDTSLSGILVELPPHVHELPMGCSLLFSERGDRVQTCRTESRDVAGSQCGPDQHGRDRQESQRIGRGHSVEHGLQQAGQP
jgi:hypothetical protein